MFDHFLNKNHVQTDRSRAVFVLIALAGILPSALVLWFTSLAIRNEQFATARIQEEAQQVFLKQIKSDLVKNWNQLLAIADERIASLPPAQAFFEIVTRGEIDGLVILSGGDRNRVGYPGQPTRADENSSPSAMPASAVLGESKHSLSARKNDTELTAQLATQAGMLTAAIRRRDKGSAEHAAQFILGNPDFERCIDESGRHALSNVELLILENREVIPASTYASALSRLAERLNDYRFEWIPASQRRFLMGRITALTAQPSTKAIVFPTMPAESLSAQFLETNRELIAGPDLSGTTIEGVWQQRLPSGRGIALFTEQRIRKLFGAWLAAAENPFANRVQVEIVSDNSAHPAAGAEILLGTEFPGWRLRMVAAPAGADGTSLKGIYVGLSVASIGLILLILLVIASMTLRRLALAQQKNTMVATVTHELKTPVSSIKLLVDTLLQDRVLRSERVREYLNLISRENLRLTQLIENVLSFSRIERTKFRVEKQPLDVAEVIREAVATFSQQVDIAERELVVELAPDIPPIRGDAWALNRVILNLLDNAYKYSDPPRRIQVSARLELPNLVVEVSDQGIGIRAADLEKIFQQFYQADQKLSRSNEGCGLGLSIVKHIVGLHGGTISVKSKLGVGSTFTVHLPLDQ